MVAMAAGKPIAFETMLGEVEIETMIDGLKDQI
jgi:hypothetical protein